MEEKAIAALKRFYELHRGVGLFSTGSRVVDIADPLYNVSGSTDDPQIDGLAWKQLLIRNGIDGDCYVTDPLPTGATSHAQFNVGGHMTTEPDGEVPTGGKCYLMPLCNWHNSTSRNGIPFEHTATRMLELSGYMEAELAATFMARMPTQADFKIVGIQGGSLRTMDLPAPGLLDTPSIRTAFGTPLDQEPGNYLMMRKAVEGGIIRYYIDDAHFTDAGSD